MPIIQMTDAVQDAAVLEVGGGYWVLDRYWMLDGRRVFLFNSFCNQITSHNTTALAIG